MHGPVDPWTPPCVALKTTLKNDFEQLCSRCPRALLLEAFGKHKGSEMRYQSEIRCFLSTELSCGRELLPALWGDLRITEKGYRNLASFTTSLSTGKVSHLASNALPNGSHMVTQNNNEVLGASPKPPSGQLGIPRHPPGVLRYPQDCEKRPSGLAKGTQNHFSHTYVE